MITYEQATDAIVDYALSCVGLSAHPKNDPKRFGRVVAPYGPPAWVASLCAPTPPNAANSTCEVFAVACDQSVAEQLGITALVRPLAGAVEQWGWYVPLTKHLGAHRTLADGPPTVGSIVHVESKSSRHWYRVIAIRPGPVAGSWLLTTVDGGQDDRGYQAIARCEREIRGGHEWVRGGPGRPVVDWIDSPALLVALSGGGPAATPTAPAAPAAPTTDTPTLRRGMRGAAVARWQPLVGAKPDGDFGPTTERLTRELQARHGLTADGVVGPMTWRAGLTAVLPSTPGTAPTPRPSLECLDVADHQAARWDVARVRAAGVSVVWSRATDGVDWIDPGFAANVAQARRIGAEPGGYHFVRVRHVRHQDGAEQGRQHVVAARAQGIRIASWVDAERGPENDRRFAEHNAATREEWHAALWETLESIERHSGIPPKLYTFVAHLLWLRLPAKFTRWGLVIADYRNGRAAPGIPEGLAPWSPDGWEGWQYAAGPQGGGNVGRVDGIPIPVDRSVYRRSVAELMRVSA